MKLTIRKTEGDGKCLTNPVEVLLDDKPLENVRSVEFSLHPNNVAVATIVLLPSELELDGVPLNRQHELICKNCGESQIYTKGNP